MLKNFKRCREELELTQKELGEVLCVNRATINGWENGFDPIPLTHLVKFCNTYKFTLDYVTGLSDKNIDFKEIPVLNKKKIGNTLKAFRSKLNCFQKDIAKECGISSATISDYEVGRYLISTTALYTICKKHKISMDKFLSM